MSLESVHIRIRIWLSITTALLSALSLPLNIAVAEESTSSTLSSDYQTDVRPLLARYCHDCHGGDLSEGEINLAAMSNWDEASKHPSTWQEVAEMLGNGLMPPEGAEQPSLAERERLQKWLREYLTLESRAKAGDPGRVVLRRLSNAEYTFTVRDLTGVESLDPAREFPADGAAGEGFTNTGSSLVMSPALVTKYLDAAKQIASHAVLLPDGFRFSQYATTRDWTDETLARIRNFYGQYSDASGGSQVNLQGVVFDTNQGGRLPLEEYLAATLSERDALTSGSKSIGDLARERELNPKYLGILWANLTGTEPSLVLDGFRTRWRAAKPEDAEDLVTEVESLQKTLWSFSSVGLIGREGGPKRWMEPVDPLTTKHEFRFELPKTPGAENVSISLVATDAGDGNDGDFVIWQAPRLVSPGQPDLLLRDVRRVARELHERRSELFANAAAYLNAAEEIAATTEQIDLAAQAGKHGVNEASLRAWLEYLGIGTGNEVTLEGHFTNKLTEVVGYRFVNGWGSGETPSIVANSSDEHVRIPGALKPHSVAVHPSPTSRAAVGWRSPIAAKMRVEASVTSAHSECGNGITYTLERRRGATRQRLATGVAQGADEVKIGPFDGLLVRQGDVIAISIGPRDGNHSCDLAAIVLQLTEQDNEQRSWNLGEDVSGNVLAGNPHADRFGNSGVWHFYAEADSDKAVGPVIPAGSLLAKWQSTTEPKERQRLAMDVQQLLVSGAPRDNNDPDVALYRQMASLSGPLLGGFRGQEPVSLTTPSSDTGVGPDPAQFGHHPNGSTRNSADLCVKAPSVFEIELPADLVAGCELVTTGILDRETAAEGSVQLTIVEGKHQFATGLRRGKAEIEGANMNWLASNQPAVNTAPILVTEGSTAQLRVEKAFEEFRQLFPPALCYTKIVPVDEVISLTLFYREDDHLARLMLDESQMAHLDRLWNELRFVSRDALASVDAYAQLMEFATQDADPKVFEPLRQPINDRAEAFRQLLVDCEPKQLSALIDFAALAYRRPLSEREVRDLRELYERLREELSHEEAFRLTLAKVLVAPAFLYRIEKPIAGAGQGPVSDWELATRLSYFLWASQPDSELREVAAHNELHKPEKLISETQRMLLDGKTRRLATQFACHWLHIDDFANLDEKSERHFPTFASLREPMAEESILFFSDLFQHNGSILDILDADYTFLNEALAQHYGIPNVTGSQWRRVEGVKQYSRGGILAQATTLAKQSGASRTSPILRGNWISEVLLGERLPKPPKGVPPLPDDEVGTEGLTVRQLVERHVSDPKCSVCHQRIDPYGFALESFDAIGAYRESDLANRPIDAHVTTIDGAKFEGLDGLRNYLLTQRRDAFVRQFCRKLLGYALARTVQLSDEPLLTEMQTELAKRDYRVHTAVEMIVQSRQFREIRGAESASEE